MPSTAVLFDLDGTLLDTLADIAGAANTALSHWGHPPHPVEAYRDFVGSGVYHLFARTLPESSRSPLRIQQSAELFRDAYRKQWNVHTRPYPGIGKLLAELGSRSVPMAVLSNKPHEATVRCVESMLGEYHFEVVLGQRDEVPCKPDPAAAFEIAGQMDLAPEQFLFVGDTITDVQTSLNAGMRPVGVSWGFRPRQELTDHGAEVVLDDPAQLLDLLLR